MAKKQGGKPAGGSGFLGAGALIVVLLGVAAGVVTYQGVPERLAPLVDRLAPLVEQYRATASAAVLDLLARVEQVAQSAKATPAVADVAVDRQAACGISGKVAGCECDFASTETLIHQELKPVLSKLVKLPFFRYFKVNLYCDCEFWPDAGMCFSKDCCVEACDDSEVPAAWLKEHHQQQQQQQQHAACSDPVSPVDRSVDEGVAEKLSSVPNWSGLNNPWVPEDDKGVEYIYVNLALNPERYTGYKGEDARRIWASIYAQSAFEDVHAAPALGAGGDGAAPPALEKQVLYRLISGMHSSITTSIIQNFYNETSETWGPNLPFFKARFMGPAARPYIENLYFTFLFLLRAVMKAGPTLNGFDFYTGSAEEAQLTRELVQQLESSPALLASCPEPFDEGLLWQAREPAERHKLEEQLQVAFHNITKLMDCVGCEKCKMWGKVQMLGIATSLKILFSQQQAAGPDGDGAPPPLQLHRNEVIALVNLLAKVADSVETVRQLSLMAAGR